MKRSVIIFYIFFISIPLFAQTSNSPVKKEILLNGIFVTFDQFLEMTPCEYDSIQLKDSQINLLTVKDINSSCEDFKKINSLIAISYGNEVYYNMRYNIEFSTKNRFAKLVVIGRYCAFVVDESMPMVIQGQAGFNSGGLVGGTILSGTGGIGKNKIYFIDTRVDHKLKVLSTSRLKELLEENKSLLESFENSEPSVEVYIEYLRQLNELYP
ncbi:hypothetical protein KFE94_04750 [bacterium SCSIO 12643]|nr:hypothetical protein KFE94_04750 [bacterium SCSIO 12643]